MAQPEKIDKDFLLKTSERAKICVFFYQKSRDSMAFSRESRAIKVGRK